VAARGAHLIDSPVLGTIPQVREGKLVALIGGLPESLARARPLLEKLTRRIEHMGPNGSGYAMKLAVNLGLGAYIEALSESLALGMRQGLSLDQMLEVLQEAPYASGWMKSKIGVLKGEKPAMTLDIRTLRKDIMSAVATGALSGVPMPLAAGTLTTLSAAVANGHGSGDLGELAKFLRESMVQDFG
jgi:3-hydroxyisobutyrate dehydrogenase-like beta-hydroxyacid dehydrogenase